MKFEIEGSVDMTATEKSIVKLAGEHGAKVAIATLEKERKRHEKESADRRMYNTKLLLRNYRLLKMYIINAVSEPEETDSQVQSVLDAIWENSETGFDDTYVDAIRRTKTRTAIIVNHIEDMLMVYEAYCMKSGRPDDMRKFRVIKALYIDSPPKTSRMVADAEMIDVRTVYKDVDAACMTLSPLLFGVAPMLHGKT